MKARRGTIHRLVGEPDPAIRFYLFHGPDEAGARELAERLRRALGAEKVAVAASAAKSDPALLAAEAGAISLFGDARLVWVDPAGDELADAVAALLEAKAVESPVVAIAGTLRKSSALLKLAEGHAAALAHACYAPEGQDATRLVIEAGREEGLVIDPSLAARLAAACNGNRAILAHELAKFALYLDAAPDCPKDLSHDTVDRLGADSGEGDLMRLGDLALTGDAAALFVELDRAAVARGEAIPVVRALQRRLLQLAALRARIEQGSSVGDVMTSMGKALFWKDKPLMQQLLSNWSAERLAAMVERSAALERSILFSDEPPIAALAEELATIARAARRR